MSLLLDALSERVLLLDCGMGSHVQALDLDIVRDYDGCENCPEVLNRSRPEIIRDHHRNNLLAGSDVLLTNSFGGSPLTLAEFDLAEEAPVLNRRAAEIAREAIDDFAFDGREHFVLGSIGPGTRLPSLGHVDYDSLEAALEVQAAGLVAGGVDGILIETCQDPLQIKAAVNGARLALAAVARTDAGDDDPALADKVVIARFWAEQHLPLVRGRLGSVTAGFDDLMALGADRFSVPLM